MGIVISSRNSLNGLSFAALGTGHRNVIHLSVRNDETLCGKYGGSFRYLDVAEGRDADRGMCGRCFNAAEHRVNKAERAADKTRLSMEDALELCTPDPEKVDAMALGLKVEEYRAEKAKRQSAKTISRSFGALQWDCVTPGSHWSFDDGWGRFDLRRYNGEGQPSGWYLDTPDESGDWVGNTLVQAAAAAQSIVLAAHPKKDPVYS